jgi:acyl dehydratase
MSSKIDIDTHRDKIGTVWEYEIGEVTRKQVRRYARAVEDDNPLFHDIEHAVAAGFDDLVIPPNYLPASTLGRASPRTNSARTDSIRRGTPSISHRKPSLWVAARRSPSTGI